MSRPKHGKLFKDDEKSINTVGSEMIRGSMKNNPQTKTEIMVALKEQKITSTGSVGSSCLVCQL